MQTKELKRGRPGNEATSMLHVCLIVSETLVKYLIMKFELQFYPRGQHLRERTCSRGLCRFDLSKGQVNHLFSRNLL